MEMVQAMLGEVRTAADGGVLNSLERCSLLNFVEAVRRLAPESM